MKSLVLYPSDFAENEVGMTWTAVLQQLGVSYDSTTGMDIEAVTLTISSVYSHPADTDSSDTGIDESMDGDHASALASVGWGTDEDYGGGGEYP